ncbi:TPA: hypothetical protein DD449_03465 [Candidatus Berkelbacteria bacterium]|uniref:STAS domain-containing protein n=1 Tax=Berkelbacteria bacterium GW2011_GWE1_39_12 TaxID=1618337 RepID=A0A0G4B2M5_9BACT|nr:MAG: hypothetical protein UT28_C0001G0325 [Berkelbacteria bacterium GW2011_GWE1_39_12]HBO60716.1 hypothetical protein [Candidatus Berkelbacteria bacterium]
MIGSFGKRIECAIECDGKNCIVMISHDGVGCETVLEAFQRLKRVASPQQNVVLIVDDDCCAGECIAGLVVSIRRWQGGNGGRTIIAADSSAFRRNFAHFGFKNIGIPVFRDTCEAFQLLA